MKKTWQKKFPVLYDKSNDEFYRKDIKKNAWTKVAESLGIHSFFI